MSRQSTFWARRRAAVSAEAEAEQQALDVVTSQKAQEERFADKSDAEILEELGLPDPESMEQGDDFTAFMSRQVPDHLRRMALRKLWRSNPVLACVDGLNDYDDDYRAAALAQGPVKTAYQVGKGMLAHIVEKDRSAGRDAVCDEATPDDGVRDIADAGDPDKEDAPGEEAAADAPQAMASTSRADAPAEDGPLHPRRMRFSFAEAKV